MSVRAHSRWNRWAALIPFAFGCQAVLGDFTIDSRQAPVTLGDACRPNAYRCQGAKLELCADDRSGYRLLEECASADQCDPTAGACRPCSPGEFACNENVLLSCSSAGVWTVASVCGTAELCQPGSDRRSGDCLDDDGCDPGDVRCRGDLFERCTPSGERFDLVERCADAGSCSAELIGGEVTGCLPAACEGENCPPPECENGSMRCDPTSGLTLQRCNSAGRFMTLEACVSSVLCRADAVIGEGGVVPGRCLPPACERNETRCLGEKFQTCRGDRAWFETTEECGPGELCDPTSGCVAQSCTSGALRCNGAAFERCEDGAWLSQQICVTKDLCDAMLGCEEPACGGTLPSFRCDEDNIVYQCTPGRDRWEEINTCSGGDICVPERPFCIPPPP